MCRGGISLRPGKQVGITAALLHCITSIAVQAYVCRDCGLVTHKPCHIKVALLVYIVEHITPLQVELGCQQSSVPGLQLECYPAATA